MEVKELSVQKLRKFYEARGIYFKKDAFDFLIEAIKSTKLELRQKFINQTVEAIEKEESSNGFYNLATLKEIMLKNSNNKANLKEDFMLENANECRNETFDEDSKKYCTLKQTSAWRSHTFTALCQRFKLVKDHIDEHYPYQSSIETLFSCNGFKVCIVGVLTRGTKNELMVEDFTGNVQIDITNATYNPALYFEGGIFEFEGVYNSGIFTVSNMSLPQIKTVLADLKLSRHEKRKINNNPDDRIVFLSDVFLDEPKVLRAIYTMLSGFSTYPPDVFVFCGKFLKTQLAYGYSEAAETAFQHLANIFAEFEPYFCDTKFVLVPSLNDLLPVHVLPCLILPPTIRDCFSELKNVFFATNPCRMTFKKQTFLIFRDDIIEKICKASIHVPPNSNDISEFFCETIWSQFHISPLPLYFNPILPQFDHFFHIRPAPDVLVLADKYKAFYKAENKFRCVIINPGSFSSSNFEFQVYYCGPKNVEASSIKL